MSRRLRASILVIMFCLGLASTVSAQNNGDNIPPFKLWQTNGRTIGPSVLPAGKPLVLIYFAPDCGHCTTLLNGVFKEIKAFKNTTLLLATFKPLADLQSFERSYKTATHPNIITGTEGATFMLRNFYRMQKTPFVAFYNKAGKLVRTYGNEPTVKDLLGGLKAL